MEISNWLQTQTCSWELAVGSALRGEEAAFFVEKEERISMGTPARGSAEPTKRLWQGHKAGVLLWLSPVPWSVFQTKKWSHRALLPLRFLNPPVVALGIGLKSILSAN